MNKHLILGGARSGKSYYAEQQALTCAKNNKQQCWYIATATIGDHEMQRRVEQHQHNRDSQWRLVEEPLDLAQVIQQHASKKDCLLIDCLTLWLTNALTQQQWMQRKKDFLEALVGSQASIFMVSNEVGSGIVPLGELSRQFVDESGWLHQELATLCDDVTLVVAGLPVNLK